MEVAIVTVGDELLAGDTVNTNASWLGRELTDRGVDVGRVTVVPDEVDEIATVLQRERDRFDAVIVTGGLGPTHDDRTMPAIAEAFDRPLVRNETALEWLVETHGYEADSLAEGTAELPADGTPLHNDEGVAPGVRIENVYVFPGVPTEMEAMFRRVADDFSGVERHTAAIRVDEPESALVSRLDQLRSRFDVRVGSYPREDVLIRISGEDETQVEAAVAWLRERVTRSDADDPSPEEHVHPDGGHGDAKGQDPAR